MFDGATRVLCDRYGLDRSGVISRARAFEAKPVGDRAGVLALDEVEDRTGEPAERFEVARRVFWTAFGDACEREGVARGWADAAIAAGRSRLRRAREGRGVRRSLTFRSWSVTATGVLDVAVERNCGVVRPSGAVERSVADVVADRLLSNVGVAGPGMDLDQRDSPPCPRHAGPARCRGPTGRSRCSPRSRRVFAVGG